MIKLPFLNSALQSLWFASDAELMGLVACGFLIAAAISGVLERRRLKRRDIQRVGWVPWMGIFMGCVIIAGGLLVVALPPILMG